MVAAGLLFAGALIALALRQELVFWVLAGLSMVWLLVGGLHPEGQPRGADDDLVARVEGDGVDAPAVDE